MNRERTLLIIFALVGAYLAGYYQVTPLYLYSLTGKTPPVVQQPAQTPAVVVPRPAVTSAAQPTPFPTPWPAPEVAER